MDKLFDALNSRFLYDKNTYKSGLTKNNFVYQYLIEMKTYFKNVKVDAKKVVYCINGLIQTIDGLLLFVDNIFDNNDYISYLLTSRVNSDSIENTFSQIRSRCPNKSNPSVHEFGQFLAKIISMKLIDSKSINSNCIAEGGEFLNWENANFNVNNNTNSNSDQINDEHNELVNNADNSHDEEVINLLEIKNDLIEENSMRYVCGYTLFK